VRKLQNLNTSRLTGCVQRMQSGFLSATEANGDQELSTSAVRDF